ncbi:MAG: methyl-accepting chemotaxis protein [Betaproteobacteria bacterium]|nr:methyl-accepting chemotaxis protein [Betaproteobacteria bacterium]
MTDTHPRGREARMQAPTTSVEHFVDPKHPIVTKTDLKGKITYVNRAFVEMSGYSEEELLGKPHNIVRHPDMPREAFADLWNTIRLGIPWRGRVKNRAKNGDYYWVDAYVSPITENGNLVGYMSVRGRPNDEAKRGAEALYAEVRAGRAAIPTTPVRFGTSLKVKLAVFFPALTALGVGAALLPQPWNWGLAGGLALACAGGYAWLWNEIARPLARIKTELRHLSEGDLKHDTEPEGSHEFAEVLVGLRSAKVNLRAVLSDVVTSTERVERDCRHLVQESEQLLERSRRQSDGISGVASALEELSVSVNEISDATQRSSEHAEMAIDVVADGTRHMAQSLDATHDVVRVVDAARSQIESLGEAVGKISVVTRTIQEIAEQTNLLALNAAIEAARAGEQGRGFAVVADEVRKLAERTRSSTVDIAATVAEVQAGTATAIETMRNAVDGVHRGTGLIRDSNDSLGAIDKASRGVGQSARDIASMLEQQSRASQEVAQSMERMSALTEENLTSISSVEASVQTLAQTTSDLHKLLEHFERKM